MIARKILIIGTVLTLVSVLFVAFLGMTRMMHDGEASFMGCSDGMSPSCFVADIFNHLDGHVTAFRFLSLAISGTIFLAGLILLVFAKWFHSIAIAPPPVFISRFFKIIPSVSRFRFLGWLAVHFRTVPSFP